MAKHRPPISKHSSGKTFVFFVVIGLVFIGIRLINLPQVLEFSSDQGRDFLNVWRIYHEKKVAVIGPPSQYSIQGRQFFFGPAPYYVILPALIAGKWDPLVVSYFLILLNAGVLFVSLLIFSSYVKDKTILYLFALFYTFTPALVQYTRSYWNPYFMLATATFLLALLFMSRYRSSVLFFGFLGVVFGLGLQFHFSFFFAIGLSMVWLFLYGKLNLASLMSLFMGFCIGFLPLIVYDVFKDFYNLRTLFIVFTNGSAASSTFKLHPFYFISLVPFGLMFVSFLLSQLRNKQKLILYGLVSTIMIWSLASILPVQPSALNYPSLQTLSKVIEIDQPAQFNIVDQLTLDNRAMALRYFLTINGYEPMGVTDYPQARTLYIYTKENINTILAHPIWEIASGQPYIETTHVATVNGIDLYKLQK